MKQDKCVKFVSENNKIAVLCDNDTSLGDIHDFLMKLKGNIVDRMVEVQKQEDEQAKKQKELSEEKAPEESKT
jgi:hypothetical protein